MLYSYSHAASHPAWQDSINLGIRRVVATYPTADPIVLSPRAQIIKSLCAFVLLLSVLGWYERILAHGRAVSQPARAMNITLQDEGFLHLLTLFYNKHNA